MFEKRIEKLRSGMEEGDYFLISSAPSLRYFTGFKAHEDVGYALIHSAGKSIVVTDGRYEVQIEKEVDSKLFDILMVKLGKGYTETLKEEFSPVGPFRMHIEDRDLRVGPERKIKEHWPKADLLDSSNIALEIRSIKEPEEITLIKKAIQITEEALRQTLPLIKVGVSENDIAAEITYRQKKLGASGDAFPLQVLAGENSVLPHGVATKRIIRAGDLVQFDIGCVYEGYHSDISRVVVVGTRPAGRQHEIYQTVHGVQEECISRIKPGINLKRLFQYYRASLKRAGFEIQHNLGHGIGLEIHELPNSSPKDFIAKPGHVLTVEPGVYIPGWGGIRIEDDVFVTETGYEVLTSFDKYLIPLDI